MKGLLYKELVVLRDSLRILGVVAIALLAMAMLSAASLQMIGSILSLCVVTLAVSSFSYDDLADWDIYAAAMPLRRWELVSAKYLLVLILIVMAGVLNAVLAIAAALTHGSFDGTMFLIFGALAALGSGFLDLILIPLIYRYGAEKSRLLLMGIIVFLLVAVYGGARLMSMAQIRLAWPAGLDWPGLLIITTLIFIAALALSWLCSIRIMAKKEF